MSSFLIDDRMMSEGLGLKGCCLLLFAMAMSYHKVGSSLYESERAIAERTGYAREVIGRSLQALVKDGYLTRSNVCGRDIVYMSTESAGGRWGFSRSVIKSHIIK